MVSICWNSISWWSWLIFHCQTLLTLINRSSLTSLVEKNSLELQKVWQIYCNMASGLRTRKCSLTQLKSGTFLAGKRAKNQAWFGKLMICNTQSLLWLMKIYSTITIPWHTSRLNPSLTWTKHSICTFKSLSKIVWLILAPQCLSLRSFKINGRTVLFWTILTSSLTRLFH